MFYAFRVGPVETRQGAYTMYAGCAPSGEATFAIEADDHAGLTALRVKAGRAKLACEPALADVGRALGYRSHEWSAHALEVRATFATMLHLGAGVAPPVVQLIPQLLESVRTFVESEPWRLARPEHPVDVTIELGARGGRREWTASVLGADAIERGVALYQSHDELARFVELANSGRTDEVRKLSTFSLTIDDEPAWVADAVESAYRVWGVPIPMRSKDRTLQPCSADDIVTLSAAMLAIARLSPEQRTSEITLEMLDGGVCRATASLPDVSSPAAAWIADARPLPRAARSVGVVVPMIPVSDLSGAIAGMRALGFEIEHAIGMPIASAWWPGAQIDLIDDPSSDGGVCQLRVVDFDGLVAAWRAAGVELELTPETEGNLAVIELPGNLRLLVGQADIEPARAPRKKRSPRKSPPSR